MEQLAQISTSLSTSKTDDTEKLSALVEVAEHHNELRKKTDDKTISGGDNTLYDLINTERTTTKKRPRTESNKVDSSSENSNKDSNPAAKSRKGKKKDNDLLCSETSSSSLSCSPNSSSSESGFTSSTSTSVTSSAVNSSGSKSGGKYTASSVTTTDSKEVVLERQVLLSMTSNAFEQYAIDIANVRPLTSTEEKQLKAQRRLISNRESAQASRKRKKAYVEELETKLSEMGNKNSLLQANNASLSAQIGDLENENASLKNQLAHERANSNNTDKRKVNITIQKF